MTAMEPPIEPSTSCFEPCSPHAVQPGASAAAEPAQCSLAALRPLALGQAQLQDLLCLEAALQGGAQGQRTVQRGLWQAFSGCRYTQLPRRLRGGAGGGAERAARRLCAAQGRRQVHAAAD